jgi:hypothetical protein
VKAGFLQLSGVWHVEAAQHRGLAFDLGLFGFGGLCQLVPVWTLARPRLEHLEFFDSTVAAVLGRI